MRCSGSIVANVKLIVMHKSPKKGLFLRSHPCGCWRTGTVPADFRNSPTVKRRQASFIHFTLKTIRGAKHAIATNEPLEHFLSIDLWQPGLCPATSPKLYTNQPNVTHPFFSLRHYNWAYITPSLKGLLNLAYNSCMPQRFA